MEHVDMKHQLPNEISTNTKKQKKNYTLRGALFMLILSIVFLTAGGAAQLWDANLGILITEFIIVLGGSLLFAATQKVNIKEFFRLKPARFSVFVKMFFMSFFMLPIAYFLNFSVMLLIDTFGTLKTPNLPITDNPLGILGSLFVIAVSAGICEEMMFRGALLSTFEKPLGRKKAAILSAVLFGVFHFNLGNLVSPIALGIVFAYVTHVTGSIFPAMFGHFMNNGIAVVMGFIIEHNNLLNTREETPELNSLALEMTTGQIVVQVIILLLIVTTCIFIVRAFLKSIKKSYPKRPSDLLEDQSEQVDERLDYMTTDYTIWQRHNGKISVSAGIIFAIVGIAYVVLSYITFFSPSTK